MTTEAALQFIKQDDDTCSAETPDGLTMVYSKSLLPGDPWTL
jgi:hypothetical protein